MLQFRWKDCKNGKMKGATIKVNISTFHELTHYNAESPMKPGKD